MTLLFVIGAMIIVGLVIGYLAGLIWKDNRPIGVQGDYIAAVITTVLIGLLDWLVIPAMGFSDTMRILGVMFEPALGALIVLWVIRKSKS
jgi:uncharacterized membrane protein YeaQ/YmgE (transglycosylase-associated protein family)